MHFPKWPRWVWRCYAAVFAAVATFVVCSFWPMWSVMSIGPICGFGQNHTLWEMLGSDAPGNYSYSNEILGNYSVIIVWQWETPAVITAVAVQIAAILGAILGGVRWQKNAEQPRRGGSE